MANLFSVYLSGLLLVAVVHTNQLMAFYFARMTVTFGCSLVGYHPDTFLSNPSRTSFKKNFNMVQFWLTEMDAIVNPVENKSWNLESCVRRVEGVEPAAPVWSVMHRRPERWQ